MKCICVFTELIAGQISEDILIFLFIYFLLYTVCGGNFYGSSGTIVSKIDVHCTVIWIELNVDFLYVYRLHLIIQIVIYQVEIVFMW